MSNATLIIATLVAIIAIAGLFLLLRKPKQRVSLSDTPAPVSTRSAEPALAAAVIATPAPAPAQVPEETRAEEGHGVVDSAAAAILDVATPVLSDSIARACLEHHERYDGTGFPNRVGGSSLSLLGRMAAICDAFDLMVAGNAMQPALDPAQAAEVDARLGAFKGRIFRDRWIDQARYLEQNDIAGFEKEFGKLG